jgi:hypothetical protein
VVFKFRWRCDIYMWSRSINLLVLLPLLDTSTLPLFDYSNNWEEMIALMSSSTDTSIFRRIAVFNILVFDTYMTFVRYMSDSLIGVQRNSIFLLLWHSLDQCHKPVKHSYDTYRTSVPKTIIFSLAYTLLDTYKTYLQKLKMFQNNNIDQKGLMTLHFDYNIFSFSNNKKVK